MTTAAEAFCAALAAVACFIVAVLAEETTRLWSVCSAPALSESDVEFASVVSAEAVPAKVTPNNTEATPTLSFLIANRCLVGSFFLICS